jgi:hypothetical protein
VLQGGGLRVAQVNSSRYWHHIAFYYLAPLHCRALSPLIFLLGEDESIGMCMHVVCVFASCQYVYVRYRYVYVYVRYRYVYVYVRYRYVYVHHVSMPLGIHLSLQLAVT